MTIASPPEQKGRREEGFEVQEASLKIARYPGHQRLDPLVFF